MFFFEKKNQKTFASSRVSLNSTHQRHKSFLLLFFKKEVLPFSRAAAMHEAVQVEPLAVRRRTAAPVRSLGGTPFSAPAGGEAQVTLGFAIATSEGLA
jgi:hypothetical protein